MADGATSELPQPSTVRDHVLYSTKCLLKSQLRRCALVRPQVYARLCEHSDGGEDDDIITLDRLPRFRFGGNRTNAKARELDRQQRGTSEQRFRDLTDRLKRGPTAAARLRAPAARPPPPPPPPPGEGAESRVAPARSVSFSQVDYSADDNKYVRRRASETPEEPAGTPRSAATLPRSKNPQRPVRPQEGAPAAPDLDGPAIAISDVQIHIEHEPPEQDAGDTQKLCATVRKSPTTTEAASATQEKKRDKSRRRKGIYLSQWPNYPAGEDVMPQFIDNGDYAACSSTNNEAQLHEEPLDDVTKLQISDAERRECASWSGAPEEALSQEGGGAAPERAGAASRPRQPDERERDALRAPCVAAALLRSDSLSEGEPESGERKSECNFLASLDASDCESRLSFTSDMNTVTRRYSKRPLRGPYGQMLEAEMKKPETGRKNQLHTELKFLEDLSASSLQNLSTGAKAKCKVQDEDREAPAQRSVAGSPKRKISADSLIVENQQNLVVTHQRTTSSPSKLEDFSSGEASSELLEQLLQGNSEKLTASEAHLRQKNDTRTHVVVEVYENERSYVEALEILVTKYGEPLKCAENAHLLDATQVDDVFNQIPILLNHHQIFLDELKRRLDHWDIKQRIGDVFLEMFSKPAVIESYTKYVNNWKRAREIIKCAQNSKPAFARFLEATAREHKGKLALDSLLIKPIQKFPKYELLIQRLLKHTDAAHPDHSLLLSAQREVHDQLLKINCNEREALELEHLREIEGLIEGVIDLVSADRQYLRHDLVSMSAGGGPRKDRALFLFSDLLLVTSIKRRSGTIRRTAGQPSNFSSSLEANKYKLLMKIALEDLEIVKSKDENLKQIMNEIDSLNEDLGVLNQINELSWSLHTNHVQLDEVVKDMLATVNKQLIEQQNSDSQLSCLDLALSTTNGLESISVVFSKHDKRSSWEESFNEAKNKLAMSDDKRLCPELTATVPIRKTRAGLQFTCAAPTMGGSPGDVWVCNSDGYVGQVCVLSLHPEPTVTSCNGVCNARILCIASVAGVNHSHSFHVRGHNNINNNNNKEEKDVRKAIQFDSSSSSDEEYKSDNEEVDETQKASEVLDCASVDLDDIDTQQSTMWLGTEDGCIHVYNSSDNIRIKKNKIRLQLNSSILCIVYKDDKVFVSLANGDLTIYERDSSGNWNVYSPTTVTVGSTCMPVTKMISSGSKLWCGCGNTLKVFNTTTYAVESNFIVNHDNNKYVSCLAIFGSSVWVSLQNSAIVKCFHTSTFEALCEVNVAPAVTKMLTSCDDIIRQHKAACLRVTALLACRDLLWIGTSAGVLLTMPLTHMFAPAARAAPVPTVTGVPYGHTGHVRFLAHVDLGEAPPPHRNSCKGKPDGQRHKYLVISGGDGYEDFRSSNLSEVAGREDSTNHLLLWNI